MFPSPGLELSLDSVGAKEIAAQHRHLMTWLARLDEALVKKEHPQIEDLLEFLAGYVVAQFSVEARLMVDTGYQNRQRHHEAHERLSAELVAIKSHYQEKKTVACTRGRFTAWLDQLKVHLSVDDRMMAEHAELRRQPPVLDLLPPSPTSPLGIVREVVSALTGRISA
jgi:hemerythrin-like metal-binding protein